MLDPLGNVQGIPRKELALALSDLLLGSDPRRTLWIEAGAGMVVVDTLVHNWRCTGRAELHGKGVLTDAEFARLKASVVGPGEVARGEPRR